MSMVSDFSRVVRHGRVRAAVIVLLACAQLSRAMANNLSSGCSTVPGTYSVDDVLFRTGVDGAGTYEAITDVPDNFRPNITSAADCCAACKTLTVCNLWNYCDRKNGCYTNENRITTGRHVYDSTPKLKLKNSCYLRRSTGYYEYKNLKALDGPSQFISGKIDSRAPKKESHPPAVPNEWKCASNSYLVDPNSERCKQDPYAYCKKVCAGASCRPVRGLYNTSQILNHEVNSFWAYNGENHPAREWSASQCCKECSRTKRCNVWNYCWDPLGCGPPGSCTAYVAKWLRPERKYLGPLASDCTLDGRFPQDYCILRKADGDLKKLKVTGATEFYSWTSGTVTK